MKQLRFLIVFIFFAAFISIQDSKAQAVQEFEEKSFDRYYFDCLGEGGAGSIIIHHVYLFDKLGNLKAIHSNIIEGWFVGAESGTVYKVIDTHKYSQQIHKNNLQTTGKYQISFKLISPKNGKSFPGYANLQQTFNAHGEMTVYRWEIDLCFDPQIEE